MKTKKAVQAGNGAQEHNEGCGAQTGGYDAITATTGKSGEYAPLQCNYYMFCTHGCKYCYGPGAIHKEADSYFNQQALKKDFLARLEKDASKMALRGDDREVLLSFIGDPYQPCEVKLGVTRKALEILIANNLRFTVLTKGGTRASCDFSLLAGHPKARFGTSLVFMSQKMADEWEPGAAPVADRIKAIRKAHAMGIPTWVSMEPVVDPGEAMAVIRELSPVVKHWKVGKLNYRRPDQPVDWIAFREEVRALLDSLGADYYLKRSLTELTA